MNRRFFLNFSLVSGVAMAVSACGWRLRGKVDLPYKTLLVTGNMTPEFRNDLNMVLRANEIAQTTNFKEADLILQVLSEQNAKQVLSFNSAGQITAYRIITRIVFRAYSPDGIEVMPEADIYLTRDIEYNPANIQAFDQLVNDYVKTMRFDLVMQLIRRLASIKKIPKEPTK